jgi:esterase FrsA
LNDVDELKRFVAAHANAQGIPARQYGPLLRAVDTDAEGAAGSWARQWAAAADRLADSGRPLDACRFYTMARFPYVDGPARQRAQRRGVEAFDQWRRTAADILRLDVPLTGGRVRCWAGGLSTSDPKPLLLIMGGIVSVKEQWGPALVNARQLGMAVVVAEMPGVGENTMPYGPDSWRILSGLLDAVADCADVSHTVAVALSFSGHLALRCATEDPRLRGIVLAGAPIDRFFTDAEQWRALPRITVDTLAHLLRTTADQVPGRVAGWGLRADELRALDIPVRCIVSARDEIVPAADVDLLRRHVRDLRLMVNDDVHGSPAHATETRLWTMSAVLRMRGGRTVARLGIDAALGLASARRRLTGAAR